MSRASEIRICVLEFVGYRWSTEEAQQEVQDLGEEGRLPNQERQQDVLPQACWLIYWKAETGESGV